MLHLHNIDNNKCKYPVGISSFKGNNNKLEIRIVISVKKKKVIHLRFVWTFFFYPGKYFFEQQKRNSVLFFYFIQIFCFVFLWNENRERKKRRRRDVFAHDRELKSFALSLLLQRLRLRKDFFDEKRKIKSSTKNLLKFSLFHLKCSILFLFLRFPRFFILSEIVITNKCYRKYSVYRLYFIFYFIENISHILQLLFELA